MAINGLGRMAAMKADYARALRLLSAAARLLPEAGKSLMPMEQAVVDAAVADARNALSQVEADAAWAAGEDMTLLSALDYAVADNPV
jgi:roadblock/LC7 domain-containing protein